MFYWTFDLETFIPVSGLYSGKPCIRLAILDKVKIPQNY